MFLGHYAVAFSAKKAAPAVSLGTLLVASQLVDLLWPLFLLIGLEHVRIDPGNTAVTPLDFYDYPFTHSLAAAIGWSVLFSLAYFVIRHNRRGAVVAGLCVLSHWFLDFVSHRPDLPLAFGHSMFFGLGLWNNRAATFLVEAILFAAGIALVVRSTKAKNRIGIYGWWLGIALLGVIYVINFFGPPPPSPSAIAIAGNASWLFVAWAYWIDKNREAI